MNAKFKLDATGIEISGTEAFVETQIANFKDLINSSYEKILDRPLPVVETKEATTLKQVLLHPDNRERKSTEDVEYIEINEHENVVYENVFVNEGGKIHVIADVPGSTTSAIMINVILIILWAKMKQGIESASFSELREACIQYGHFDSSNFSRYMDNNKKFFLILGEGKNKTAKLVRPGIKEAERLITELNNKNN